MSNAESTSIGTASSPASTIAGSTGTVIPLDVRRLPSIWSSLTKELRKQLLIDLPVARAVMSSLHWMYHWTNTRDDQDPENPYKRFPQREYFWRLHKCFLREHILFIEKSRSMITSWWAAAEALHYVMTHQPSKAILWAQDERRAVMLRDYVWVLYEQQESILRELYPVPRSRLKQSYDKLELSDGELLIALPGKDPNVIRSEHPTLLVVDEACFIENGGEAFDIALASRVPKVLLVSTAAPSWLRRLTKNAVPETAV
jgi:hypothetical protein